MKTIIIVVLFGLCPSAYAQIVTTFAGNGLHANTGDGGPATDASIDYPSFTCFDDEGNLYLTTGVNGNTVRKISSTGIITTVAGKNGNAGYDGDGGSATDAKLMHPIGVVISHMGCLYMSDGESNVIRKVDLATNQISTIAGTGVAGYGGDGSNANAALLSNPNGLCVDMYDNLYVADYGNNVIRRISPDGIISTFAGTGVAGYNGDGGRADTSQIRGAFDICCDANGENIYIADEGNGRVRMVDKFGVIHTVAGNGVPGYSGDGGSALAANVTPHDITCDKYGNLFFCDLYENKIRIIHMDGTIGLLAGTGEMNFTGDGGPPESATFRRAYKVVVDTCNNLYFSDLNNYRIRKVTYAKCGYLDVPQITADAPLSIHPNPATNHLSITYAAGLQSVFITDMLGRTVLHQTLTGQHTAELPLQLPPGCYTIIVNQAPPQKLIIQ